VEPDIIKCHICKNVMKDTFIMNCTKCGTYVLNPDDEVLRMESNGYQLGENVFSIKEGYALLTNERFIWMTDSVSISSAILGGFGAIGFIIGSIFSVKNQLSIKKKKIVFSVPFSNILSVQDDYSKMWGSITICICETKNDEYEKKAYKLSLFKKEAWLNALKEAIEQNKHILHQPRFPDANWPVTMKNRQ